MGKREEAATFTVKRIKDTGLHDVETSVFIKTNDGTLLQELIFKAQMVARLNLMRLKIMLVNFVTTNTDTDNDDGEDFFVSFKSKADYEAGEDIAAHQVAYIKNDSSGADSVANFFYAITTDVAQAVQRGRYNFHHYKNKRQWKLGKISVFVSTTLGSTDSSDMKSLKIKLTFKKDETSRL